MRIAIIERLQRKEGNKPFEIQYYLNNFFKEVFDKLDILLIPVISENRLDEVCKICDGLILSGSPNDVYPKYYNEEPIKDRKYGEFDEYPLVKKAVQIFNKNNKPILGICAGIQELNVIFGGKLKQSIPNHSFEKYNIDKHKITINKDSFLYKVYNKEIMEVNTYHSQAIKDVAPNFTVTAVSDDGIIEAIEDGNILGVQWHPEAMLDEKLFKEFFEKFSNRE